MDYHYGDSGNFSPTNGSEHHEKVFGARVSHVHMPAKSLDMSGIQCLL